MKLIGMICLVCVYVALTSACGRSNNLLLGRVEANVGGHTVAVTDCYRTSVSLPQKQEDSASGKPTYHFVPCRDADIAIRDEELTVNNQKYGKLNSGDTVTVDHGKVLINDRAVPVTSVIGGI
ncbi:MAG: hypothetical protein ABIP14_05280 [Blastocatellia bacterium]